MPYKVTSTEAWKSGTNKNGKPYTIYKISAEGYDSGNSFITGFDKVNVGDMVNINTEQNGDYTNHKFTKIKEEKAAAGGAADPRVLKLLVMVAEQVGVSKESILEIIGD